MTFEKLVQFSSPLVDDARAGAGFINRGVVAALGWGACLAAAPFGMPPSRFSLPLNGALVLLVDLTFAAGASIDA